jgi:hypothetical protein
VDKTYLVPVDFESGHGLTWKYHEYEKGEYKVANGQVVEFTVRKPITGVSNLYRCFIYLVILCKPVIAFFLYIYRSGWIFLGSDQTDDLIPSQHSGEYVHIYCGR